MPTTDDEAKYNEHYQREQYHAQIDSTPPVTRMLSCVLLVTIIVFGIGFLAVFIFLVK